MASLEAASFLSAACCRSAACSAMFLSRRRASSCLVARIADKCAAGGRARCMRSSMLAMSSSRACLTPAEFSGLARRRL
eukprot:6904057-Prorocentrum_lima.AAC.1